MKLKPQNTYRHLLNFVGDASRPVLAAFHITKEGHIEATNSHILLRLLNHVQPRHELIVHPKELWEINGSYPETNRLFPSNFQSTWLLTGDEAAKISKFLKGLDKNTTVTVSADDKKLKIESDEASASFKLFDFPTGDYNGIELFVNSTYLKYITDFIADCSKAPVQLCISEKAYRPVVFKAEGQFEGLIAQIRTK
ncbi:hypothetical protein [Enterococcus faecalis]|uniref:hypothetical protein n=1 Tax=Enterococcus faecalis TaxID=1351 RepID=UPI002A758686|nr:hypothetical protein [Enterococcus faecalis]MDY2554975.1 hypothetical protein [Enterococcus faecalis]